MIRRNAGLHYRSQLTGDDAGADGEPRDPPGPKAHIDPHAVTWRRNISARYWWRARRGLGR